MTLLVDRLEVEGTGPGLRCRRVTLVVGASGLVTTLVVQLSGDPAQTKAQILIRLAWTKAWYSSDQPQTRAQSSLDRPLATALQLKPSTHQIRPEPAPDRVPGASR